MNDMNETNDVDRCDKCKYYVGHSRVYGTCRRYAPRPILRLYETQASWPEVDADEWCGEWESKA